MTWLKKPAKRILYVLRKKGTCYLRELSFNEQKAGRKKADTILRRLSEKGLVDSHKIYLYDNKNNPAARSHYWLTDKGKVVADKIVKDVKDEYDYYNEWV